MRTPRIRNILSGLIALTAIGGLWFYFAPAVIGGSTSYVVTDGISMEPRFHGGDLALVRPQSSYRVGEIVAYHNKQLHTVVLHRIVGRVGSRYVFKGDNNNFLDFEHPARSQLIGALWLHLPGVGGHLQSLRSPGLIGALIAIGTLIMAGAVFTRRRRRRSRERHQDPPRSSRLGPLWGEGSGGPILAVLALGLVVLIPFFTLALLSFTRPSSALLPASVPYRQSGTLSYSAPATPGPAYANNRAVTGDPLFTHVIKDVQFAFDYRFKSSAAHSLAGKASLWATIASTTGWQTSFELGQPSYFRGDHALATGTLDATSIGELLHRVENSTAVSGSYTLTLTPRVSAGGSLGNVPLHTTFAPSVPFTLNHLEIRPVLPPNESPGSGKPAADPFVHTASGSTTGRRYQPVYLSIAVTRLSIATARRIAIGAIVLIVAMLLAALVCVRPRRRSESDSIRARYGALIVPVARVWQQPGVSVIDVEDIDSLVRVAHHYDRSILYEMADYGDAFWVTDESGQFRYVAAQEDDEFAEYAFEDQPVGVEAAYHGHGEIHASTIEPEERLGDQDRRVADRWVEPDTFVKPPALA